MNKPEIKVTQYLEYFECIKYVQLIHKLTDSQVNKFWDYMCENYEFRNDTYINLYFDDNSKPTGKHINRHVIEVWEGLRDEFASIGCSKFLVSW